MAIVSYGTITITDTNDIERIYTVYAKSTTNTTAPSAAASSWTESISTAPGSGDYVWQRTVVEKSGTGELTYGNPVCVTGPEGDVGATGKGVKSLVTQYYLSTSSSSVAGGSWNTTPQSYPATGTKYYWTKTITTYTDNTTYESTAVYDVALTSSVKDARDANVTADEAKNIAQQTSDDLDSLTTTYNTFINTKAKYFVHNSTGSIVIGSRENESTPVTFDENTISTYGYNALMGPAQISLRYNDKILSSWSSTALTFYSPSTTTQGKKAIQLSSSGLSFYNPSNDSVSMMDLTSSGLTFKTSAGAEIGRFGSDSSGGLLDLSGRLNIKGGGRIGQDLSNYWEFGDNNGYNVSQAAYLLGRGNTSIQLGESGHWRIDKNRIHTGWYQLNDSSTSTPAGSLHFDTGVDGEITYYWDYGINYPNKAGGGNNKFLYIRHSTDSTSTTLGTMKSRIDDDSWWTYKFYVDGDGNVHAKNFYVGSSNTPVGGGTGSIAEFIINSDSSYGKGGLTQPVYIDSNGRVATTTYQLNAAGAKGIDTSTPETFSNDNVPTTLFMKNFVEGKGYLTVDEKVRVNTRSGTDSTTKGYLTFITTAPNTVGTLVAQTDSGNNKYGVYVTGTNGDTTLYAPKMSATTFNGYTLAAAAAKGIDTSMTSTSTSTNLPTTKAVADLIATYLPLAGGTVSGAVDINDELYADSATFGNLIINGGASFTNNLQANTINGVAVGNSPKFTDTVTTVTVTGNGNAITSITASNGAITATKGSTFLTSYTETDPVFTASAAHGITSSDISNWNSKTSNTGTVTSVRVQASSPLQSSTSTAQSATLNTTISFVNQNANTVLAGPASGSTAAAPTFRKLVAADIPDISGTYYLASNPSGYTTNTGTVTSVKVQGSNGLTGSGTVTTSGTITLSHSDTSSQASSSNSGRTYIQSITLDTYGHVTGLSTATETVTNTHNTAYLYAGASNGSANAETTNGNTYLILVDGGSVTTRRKISGSGAATVTSDSSGNIAINTPTSLTGVSFDSGTIIFSKSDGTTVPITTSDFVITQASGATALVRLKSGTTDEYEGYAAGGATTKPVYFDSNGHPVAVTSIPYSLLSDAPSSMTPKSHTHGNIQNNGTLQTTDITIANNDQLVVTDASDSNKIARTSVKFDGSTTTKALTPKGTWETFATSNTNTTYTLTNALASHKFTWTFTAGGSGSGSTTTTAELVAGTGISLTDDTSNKKITIGNSGVTGVKGNSESSYRTGNVNLTPVNIGAVSISGDTMTGDLKRQTTNGIVVPAASTSIYQSPIPKYLWHDVLAFCRAATPTYETSTDGTNWVSATLEKNLFIHKEAWGTSNVLTSSIKGSRWTWLNGGFYASTASWLVLGITYKNPSAHFDIIFETSSDGGSTWTTIMTSSDLYYSQTPIWIRNTGSTQDSLRLTLAWNSNSASNATLGLCSIRLLTSRWGDQGKGSEFEYPYQWDTSFNVFPLGNNISNLGTSSYKWNNVYATTFNGNATSATKANLTTTANAIAYYTDTAGTFGSKASANGALYATSANGTLTFGTLPAAQGGTGKTNLKDAANALINALDTGSSNLTSNDYVITQYVGGGTTTTTYHRRPASALRVGGLLTGRKLKVALGSTTDVTFDGTSDVTNIPVSGTLGVSNGGTGATSFTSGALLIGNGSSAVGTRSIVNNTTKGALGWTGSATTASNLYIPTLNTLAYWNGAYSGTDSNLTYCVKGAFGTATIKDSTTSVASGGTALPTAGAVYTAIRAAGDTYVTLSTIQNITANKIFSAGTKWTTESGTNPSKFGACSYNSTLEALVFSFS